MDKLKLIEVILGTKGCSESEELPFVVGDSLFIRTVTHYLTGRIKAIKGKFIILEDGAWIADTGRFMDALKTGVFNEVEPIFTEFSLNTETIIDCFPWKHPLPREQK